MDKKILNGKSNNVSRKELDLIGRLKVEKEAREYAEEIIATVREPLLVLDINLKVLLANKVFYQIFKVNPEETIGRFIYDLGNGQWDIPKLRRLLENILPKKNIFEDYEVKHSFETIGEKTMLLNARCIPRPPKKPQIILLAIEDITVRKGKEDMMQEASGLRYQRLFETAQDGILLVDADTGMILDVNPFLITLLEYSKADFLKKYLWDIGAFKDIAASKKNFLELQNKKYIRYENLPLSTKSGEKINVEFVSNVYKVGATTVIQCNIRNITERKIIEVQLQKRMAEVERLNKFMVDRELKMVELKKELRQCQKEK